MVYLGAWAQPLGPSTQREVQETQGGAQVQEAIGNRQSPRRDNSRGNVISPFDTNSAYYDILIDINYNKCHIYQHTLHFNMDW